MLRRAGILLGLLLLFAITLGLDYLTADWHYVRFGEAGETLYAATFDEFLTDWRLYDDGSLSAQVESASLQLRADEPNKMPFSISRQRFGDFDLRVRVTATDGPLDNGFGVVFRMQEEQTGSFFNYMTSVDGPLGRLVDVFALVPDKAERSYYQFLISSDGYYRISRVFPDMQRRAGALEEVEISAWIPSPSINQGIGEENLLRIVADDDLFQFFVNGERVQLCIPDDPEARSTYDEIRGECLEGAMLDTLQDGALRHGHVGVTIRTFGEPGVNVRFDDMLVLGPEAIR